MKNWKKISLTILVLLLIGGWFYWQQHKKAFIKDKIEHAISNGTDSLYYIHYDSASIDEISGSATFYNVNLQSDSLQQQLLKFDTASADAVYNVHIDQVSVRGTNIPGLISNTTVEAGSIEIINPVIYIINAGKKEKQPITHNDTLAVYERILGKFNSIKAGEIIVKNGNVFFTDKTGIPYTSLKDISVTLKNFKINSDRDYSNIISYFVKDIIVKVNEVAIKNKEHTITFTGIEYNAPSRFLAIKKFQELDSLKQVVFDINNNSINNINTDSFILRQQLKAAEFKSDGGLVKLYRKQHANGGNDQIEFENDSFDEIFLDAINIGNTKVLIYNKDKPGEAPFELNNVSFSAIGIERLYSGTNILDLVSRSKWMLSADGFSAFSKDKDYKFDIGAFVINSNTASISMNHFAVIPQLSEEAFMKKLKYQKDRYDCMLNDIQFTGVDLPALIRDKKFIAENATLKLLLNVFNDRTVTPNPASKVGKYPQQLILALNFPVDIKKVIINNGLINYKERGALSKKTGVVTFSNVNGTIMNVTNIPDQIQKNNSMLVNATGTFMGVSKLQTTWKLQLNTNNGDFSVSGNGTGFNAEALNPVIEPLGMASIKKGRVNKVSFDFTGNNYSSKGTSELLYSGLSLEMLKRDSTELKKKELMSFVANVLAKNNNPQNGNLRKGEINFQRDTTKSFFNLMWKSIFDGAKNTVQKL